MGLTKSNFYKKPEPEVVKPPEPIKKPNFTIVTSWDDGWNLDTKVADLLTTYKLQGTFYVIVDKLKEDGYLTWDKVKELDKRGFIIGSHTVTHPMDLKDCHDEELFFEVQSSKDLIEAALGHAITSFAYPRGRADERVKQAVLDAGYVEARGTGKPGVIKVEDTLYKPGTIHIFQRPEYNGEPILDFAKRTLDEVAKTGGAYCNIFGHSKEIEENNLWGVLEEVLKYAQTKLS